MFLIRFCDIHLQESGGARLERVHYHVRLFIAPYFIRARALRTQYGLIALRGSTRKIRDSDIVAESLYKGHGSRPVEFNRVLILSAYLVAQVYAVVQEYNVCYDVRGHKQFHLAQVDYNRIREFWTCENAKKLI